MACKSCGKHRKAKEAKKGLLGRVFGKPQVDAAPTPLNLESVSIRPNPNLFPDGGYTFIEGDGSRFRGDSWKNLIAQVRSYRERNRLAPGNPETEVFNQYCARLPQHCNNAAPGGPPAHHSLSFNQRVLQWFSNILEWKRKHAIPRVTDAEAARRAEICKRCPSQKTLVRSCESCLNSISHGRKVILDGAPSQHQGLLACEALGEDLPTTVHIEQPGVPADRVPGECWRKG